MKRSAILRKPDGRARLTVALPECQVCKKPFAGFNSLQIVCSVSCARKVPVIARKAERAADKAKREKLKTRGEWLAEAKLAIQRFRRLEELSKGRGCMSCKRTQLEVEGTDGWKPGGAWDGGHFIGKGARPELALEPLNIWLQCKSCNAGSGKYARKGYTVNQNFRANLIEAEGLELVEWLGGPHPPAKWTIDQLREIRDTFRARARALEKERT